MTKIINTRFDLWIILVLMYLIPETIKTNPSNIEYGNELLSVTWVIVAIGAILLTTIWLHQCGALQKGRYLILRNTCTKTSDTLSNIIIILGWGSIIYLIVINPLNELLPMTLYVTFSVLLSISIVTKETT